MPFLRQARGLLVASCLSACSSSGTNGAVPGVDSGKTAHPLDAVLHLNQLQAKGTHNSYHVEKPGNTIPDWMFTHDKFHAAYTRGGSDISGRIAFPESHVDEPTGVSSS